MCGFHLVSKFSPTGDQPEAIDRIVSGLEKGHRNQTLLGITGSGKTFTMANVIACMNRPTLVISHNKTLAAQLFSEFKAFFPHNAVEYFVSYYDYYIPESYIPSTDTYIEKESDINDEIERLRYAATGSLLTRRDVIIVASVSCIYGLGMSLEDYRAMHMILNMGDEISRDSIITKLVDMQYQRKDSDPKKGCFSVMGDTIDVYPPGEEVMLRIELEDDIVDRLSVIHPVTRDTIKVKDSIYIYPAKHFAVPPERMKSALEEIERDLKAEVNELEKAGRHMEAYRLETRTRNDIEMMRETGYCKGIENYSRYFTGRKPGEPPYTLIDYFPDDFLVIIDESHVTLPQIRAMYRGDRSRKDALVNYGFRLSSAYDNRPLRFDEFMERISQVVYTSATPGDYELNVSSVVVEQILRPTGLLDPSIEVRPTRNQVDDLLAEIRDTVGRGNRVLVTTLTKRMAEDLTEYLVEAGVKARYMHSEIDTLDRVKILGDLRTGKFDVLVGINLLREGLDMPMVELVAILDADKEGFLRSERSLIQTIGRASRNERGRVLMYGDSITPSMKAAIDVTEKRRRIQEKYNREHGITPRTITSTGKLMTVASSPKISVDIPSREAALEIMAHLEREMNEAAERLEFEVAAKRRDELKELRDWIDSL